MSANIYVTKASAAKALGIDEKTLHNWSTQEWFPKDGRRGRGSWCVAVIAAKHPGKRGNKPTVGQSDSMATIDRKLKIEELRIKRTKADREEVRTGESLALFLPRMSSEVSLSVLFGECRSFFDEICQLTHQIPPELDTNHLSANTVETWLRDHATKYLHDLAGKIDRALANLGTVPDLPALAESYREFTAASEDPDD